ncbi:MAG: hypothetical protein LUE29_02765 [Lachnospiraceae bacterium]|nr:hypothetical protein [Lachnospiraceae bacterium]
MPDDLKRAGAPARRSFVLPGTGVVLNSDGSAVFRLRANVGAKVIVTIGNNPDKAVTLELQDVNHEGIYETKLENPPFMGPQKLTFRVNDVMLLNTSAPMWYYANTLSNYVEFPDPETDDLIAAREDIPHGAVAHEFYFSKSFGKFVSSVVYTPPGYEKGGDYPVLYFFHEVAENETAWTEASRMNYVLDNLIAEKKCQPFLVVENDCTVRLDYHDFPEEEWFTYYAPLEKFMREDCPQYIASRYRVRDDKWNRAIAGVGLGAVQAGYIGLRNTDVFGSLGVFTAFWPSTDFHSRGIDDPFYNAVRHVSQHPEELKVFYHSEGDEDGHFQGVQAERELITSLGVDKHPGYVFKVYHQTHNWGSYRRSFRDFAPLLFCED